ncbi:MAG: malectin domain-containing carbohydrate-binding protein [Rhodothermales bacterium]
MSFPSTCDFRAIRCLFLSVLLGCLFGTPGKSQSLDYAFAVGASHTYDNYSYANGLAVDRDGNTFITGTLEHINLPSTYDFDPGPGEYILTGKPSTGCIEDTYLAKYDPSGQILWAFVIGGPSCDRGHEVDVDDEGNVYIAGRFNGTVDFDPGPNEYLLTGENFKAGYLAKYAPDGTFLWAIGLSGAFEIADIALARDGDVYVAGDFSGDMDLDPGEEEYLISSAGSNDLFFAKYDRQGGFLWGHRIGDVGFDRGIAIGIDAQDHLLVGGVFTGTIDVARGNQIISLTAGAGQDVFMVSYDRNGRHRWSTHLGGEKAMALKDLEIDASDGFYVTGWMSPDDPVDFDPGAGAFILSSTTQSGFIAHYASNGDFLMAMKYGEGGSVLNSAEVDVSMRGELYVAGTMVGETDFDPGPAAWLLGSRSSEDAYIAKYSAEGKLVWAFEISEAWYGMYVEGFEVDDFGVIHLAGHFGGAFQNLLDFDPSNTSYIVDYIGESQDIYLAQYRDPQPLYRVNAGGEKIPADLIDWQRDTRSTPSSFLLATGSNNKTGRNQQPFLNPTPVPDALFQSYRWDPRESPEIPMNWAFPVDEGDYTVCLLFVEGEETYWSAGARVFDVVAENVVAVNDLDIYAETGGATALRSCFYTQVTDNALDLSLSPEMAYGRPLISGIEITNVTASVSRATSANDPAEFAQPDTRSGSSLEVPVATRLERNFPNPFNPSTVIRFSLRESAAVRVQVYDLLGREVARLVDGVRDAGSHEVTFNAGDLPSGTYLYRLETPAGSFVHRMVLVK